MYDLTSGALVNTLPISPNLGVAADPKTGYVLVNSSTNQIVFGSIENIATQYGIAGDGSTASEGMDAKNGIGCVGQPAAHNVACFPLTTGTTVTETTASSGTTPGDVAMTTSCASGETDLFAVDKDGSAGKNPQAFRYTVGLSTDGKTATPKQVGSALALTGFTSSSALTAALQATNVWRIAVFDGGPQACKAAIVAPVQDKNGNVSSEIVFVGLSGTAMSFIGSPVVVPSNPIYVTTDVGNGKIVGASWNAQGFTMDLWSIAPGDAQVTALASNSFFTNSALGIGIDPKGGALDYGTSALFGGFEVIPQ